MTEKEIIDPSEDELTEAFNVAVNWDTPLEDQPWEDQEEQQEEEQEEDQEEQQEESEEEWDEDWEDSEEEEQEEAQDDKDKQIAELKAKNSRMTSKKNKWKQKHDTLNQEHQKLLNGERDDEFEDDIDRDRAIIQSETDLAYAKNKAEDLANEEIDDFFMVNTDAKDSREQVEEIMTNHWMWVEDAYKFHLATTAPEKLFDQQKANQKKWWNGMDWGQWWAGKKKANEKTADELESDLSSSFAKWEDIGI